MYFVYFKKPAIKGPALGFAHSNYAPVLALELDLIYMLLKQFIKTCIK